MPLTEITTARRPLLRRLPIPLRSPPSLNSSRFPANTMNQLNKKKIRSRSALTLLCCDSPTSPASPSSSLPPAIPTTSAPPVIKRRKRYRKLYPGESEGITEEMRFVAMRLRRVHKSSSDNDQDSPSEEDEEGDGNLASGDVDDDGGVEVMWKPSMDGFLKYLVDSKFVFDAVERIVDESSDVAYAYFRRTGLERSEGLAKDLEWLSQQGYVIPEPSNPGVSYTKYLEELAEKRAPLFLCHFYNIHFSHIAGGQVIARQVSDKLLEGRELEFYRWEGDVPELMKGIREKLNMLGEHWTRDEKNRCLKEATKSFRFLGQIVRLIIL